MDKGKLDEKTALAIAEQVREELKQIAKSGAYWLSIAVGGMIAAWFLASFLGSHLVWR